MKEAGVAINMAVLRIFGIVRSEHEIKRLSEVLKEGSKRNVVSGFPLE
jgi:hypothetical protein